ncbi:uncharacterized protein SPSC_05778 [Sporisorium scitamineum]|uniref:Uncharacterized protein n=1 Tax=Sporisorium scitamineum TaxID=49012 RepID=A0A0F7RT52_9BASI|nr:uncharacterized protein SPSC_05778 [Sporisorium scitamineum]CDR99886.1 hypothetical protein [Sporisorium scitamineum]
MNSPKEQQVFHPSSVPVDRATRQREGRKRSCQSCCYVATALFALFGAAVVFGGGYLIAKFSREFLFPLRPLAIHDKHIQPYNASQVHPLINPSSTFDIYATVLQDVTDLLARGGKLPEQDEPWQTIDQVLYKRDINGTRSNFTRTDIVVWSGRVVQGATINSKIHTSIPLRIPVAPLYTNTLGKSSLRATFSISIPQEQTETLGTFFNVSYMIPPELPILQASSDQVNQPAEGQLPEYRDGEGRFLVPHLRTRSRIGLVRSKDVFENHTAHIQQLQGSLALLRQCTNLGNAVCERPYWKYAFESLFTFTRRVIDVDDKDKGRVHPKASNAIVTDDDSQNKQQVHFYGPVLTQVSTPAAPQFLRRIPQRLPTIDDAHESTTLRSNASVACAIPTASLDPSREYFDLDWQIHFSSHTLQRVLVAESAYKSFIRPPPAPLGPDEEGEKEIAANSVPAQNSGSNVDRVLTGDRLHVKDHPTSYVVGSLALAFWHLLVDEVLLIWFWYSRRTSAGLWIDAQWSWVGVVVLKSGADVARYFIDGEEASMVSLLFGATALVHLPFVFTTLLHLERPSHYSFWSNPLAFRRRRLTRREVKSINLANSINKRPFYMLFTALFLFNLVSDHSIFVLNPADRCMVDDLGGTASFPLSRRIFEESTDALTNALLITQTLAQVYFNHRSSTFTGRFRISAIGTAVVTSFLAFAICLESFSSWADQRHTDPVFVGSFLELGVLLMFAYQAVVYRGVPQVQGEDEEDE